MKTITELTHLYFSQRPLVISIAKDLEAARKSASKALGYELNCKFNPREVACCVSNKEGAVALLFKRKNLVASTICHEVTHATNYIFSDMGIKLDNGSDEAFAYHNDMLFGMVAELLKQHQITIPLA